jgi:hypothetical protein
MTEAKQVASLNLRRDDVPTAAAAADADDDSRYWLMHHFVDTVQSRVTLLAHDVKWLHFDSNDDQWSVGSIETAHRRQGAIMSGQFGFRHVVSVVHRHAESRRGVKSDERLTPGDRSSPAFNAGMGVFNIVADQVTTDFDGRWTACYRLNQQNHLGRARTNGLMFGADDVIFTAYEWILKRG